MPDARRFAFDKLNAPDAANRGRKAAQPIRNAAQLLQVRRPTSSSALHDSKLSCEFNRPEGLEDRVSATGAAFRFL
jgi:hypothetical protein